jgi:hypothetical protein
VRAIAVLMIVVVPTLAQAERRCGWYHNPTPANVILEDADGQWWISQQGRAPTQGFLEAYTTAFDDRVRFNVSGQIITSGPGYGYSCACVDGVFDPDASQYENVVSVARLTELPVAQCEADPNLPAAPNFGN